jgi:hypothetical protein
VNIYSKDPTDTVAPGQIFGLSLSNMNNYGKLMLQWSGESTASDYMEVRVRNENSGKQVSTVRKEVKLSAVLRSFAHLMGRSDRSSRGRICCQC